MAVERSRIEYLIAARDRASAVMQAGGRRIGATMKLMAANIKRVGLAVAAATAALGGLALRLNKTADELAKFGRRGKVLGFTTAEYQAFAAAVLDSGGKLRKAEVGIRQFVRVLNEVETGQVSGRYAEAVEKLGVSLTDASGRATTMGERLRQVAAVIGEAGDATQHAGYLNYLFGGSWREIARALLGGREHMEAYIKTTEELGIAMDLEVLKKSEEAGDVMGVLGDQIKTATSHWIASTDALNKFGRALSRHLLDLQTAEVSWWQYQLDRFNVWAATLVGGETKHYEERLQRYREFTENHKRLLDERLGIEAAARKEAEAAAAEADGAAAAGEPGADECEKVKEEEDCKTKIKRKNWDITYGHFKKVSAAMAGQNKKYAKINAAIRIVEAVREGWAAAVASYRWGADAGGPVLGAAMAAASLAATGAYIKQMGGNQGAGATTTTPATGTANEPLVVRLADGERRGEGEARNVYINIEGDTLSAQSAVQLITQINEEMDGLPIRLNVRARA